ncbi:hypothetical protein F1559_001462 [Cyanidiococcus yangmingshanensis]|uniref:DNA repair protein rad51d n=1 Tax=Cyanidiococcus yangmingshanensis TaxID=2690220 RepID=A0A7J7IF16_9RHOD|nr:hypothetical protein F1559_001462 [Cyanidiococcus yangmingshanensis]
MEPSVQRKNENEAQAEHLLSVANDLTMKLPLFEELETLHERALLYEQLLGRSGVEELDIALDGGLRPGQYVEVRGPSGAGKSLLCLSILKHNFQSFRVAYLDSENHHLSLARWEPSSSGPVVFGETRLYRVFQVEDVLEALHRVDAAEERLLCNYMLTRHNGAKIRPLLLIFDAVSSFVAALVDVDPEVLIQIGLLLRKIASSYQAIVLVSNSFPASLWVSRCAPVPPSGLLIETSPFLTVYTGLKCIKLGAP